MYMHIFIIIILVNKSTRQLILLYIKRKVIYYAIYYALLTHACYIVLFCHGSTEEDQAPQETDQNSDGFTINDVVDINDRHYFNIFFSMDARH